MNHSEDQQRWAQLWEDLGLSPEETPAPEPKKPASRPEPAVAKASPPAVAPPAEPSPEEPAEEASREPAAPPRDRRRRRPQPAAVEQELVPEHEEAPASEMPAEPADAGEEPAQPPASGEEAG